MKKVWEVIKKIFMWFGALFVAIFTVLFVKERIMDDSPSTSSETADVLEDIDEINAKAAKKREEAVARIGRADARTLSESYGF